jgi:hypothetical protein
MYKVEICIPVFNRGNDVKLLLKNIEHMNKHFKDKNVIFTLRIGDFNSTDIDLNVEIKKYQYDIHVFHLNGEFNICQALQACTDSVADPNKILCIIDADTCFTEKSYDQLEFHIKNVLEKNNSFIDSMTANEDSRKRIIPTVKDHHGGGILLIYNDDFKKSNGFKDSPYMDERGTYRGGHDTYYETMLINYGLKMFRPINNNIFLRFHSRSKTNKWYIGAVYSGPPHLWHDEKVLKTTEKGIIVYYKPK